jgi:hypothetical protein
MQGVGHITDRELRERQLVVVMNSRYGLFVPDLLA